MKKLMLLFLFLLAGSLVSAVDVPMTNVSYFYSTTCSHCLKVAESGILDSVGEWENVEVVKYETSSPFARDKYLDYLDKFGIDGGGIPFLVVEQGGEFSYLMGDSPIIEDLNDSIINFRGMTFGNISEPFIKKLTLGVVVLAALIDSINPCAFGVLLFLMAVLLSMGSSKRALRAGLIYSGVVFLVYFIFGYFLSSFISPYYSFTRLIIGSFLLIGALIEIKDFFWEGVGVSLKIPVRAKPLIEKLIRKGTLPAIILLGFFVSVVELPCTGAIYLAILSMIDVGSMTGIYYLLLYNFIFVLPLIVITYLVYYGEKADVVNKWVQKNKRFMRLAAGLVMIFLALTLLNVF